MSTFWCLAMTARWNSVLHYFRPNRFSKWSTVCGSGNMNSPFCFRFNHVNSIIFSPYLQCSSQSSLPILTTRNVRFTSVISKSPSPHPNYITLFCSDVGCIYSFKLETQSSLSNPQTWLFFWPQRLYDSVISVFSNIPEFISVEKFSSISKIDLFGQALIYLVRVAAYTVSSVTVLRGVFLMDLARRSMDVPWKRLNLLVGIRFEEQWRCLLRMYPWCMSHNSWIQNRGHANSRERNHQMSRPQHIPVLHMYRMMQIRFR